MPSEGTVSIWTTLIVGTVLLMDGKANGCKCPGASILVDFPLKMPAGACCLNYSGSAFSHVQWDAFLGHPTLEILDLSNCNITQIHTDTAEAPPLLREVYLGQNSLSSLPEVFLTNASNLKVLDLSKNLLKSLPEKFLRDSEELQKLNLSENSLQSVPNTVLFRRSLQQLELSHNPWDCTCSMVETLQREGLQNNNSLEVLLGNLTCASPQSVAGLSVWSVRQSVVCNGAGLTAIFILLPLLLLLGLVLCWCCGRKSKSKESLAFGPTRKKHSGKKHQSLDCNGQRHHSKLTTSGVLSLPSESSKDGILKNQLMLRPSSALLGSSRDIYEEVEIKLGSVDSLTCPPTFNSADRQEPHGQSSKQDLETVSVSEVMKDSTDREKAYLTQATEYYSLVPEIEIEDSDHGEYESVDLS
ncbi:uncharacterized protein LOC114788830 [Denticeps clupeoides]|uniref:LRRCT domain-containing protein n=1 Tax=Denticeps clupeoides TaxID=299321 RepID=A0AAY4BHV4_9TELE|nr:uncharacterized protein LOC114788830 [Denticeps clupeoides]